MPAGGVGAPELRGALLPGPPGSAARTKRGSVNEATAHAHGHGHGHGHARTMVGGRRMGTKVGATFNLLNSMVGVGLLAMPAAVSRVGLVTGMAMLLTCGLLSMFTLNMLEEVLRSVKGHDGVSMPASYAEMVLMTSGRFFGLMAEYVKLIYLLGVCTSYMISMASISLLIVQGWLAVEDDWAQDTLGLAIDNRQLLVLIIAVLAWPMIIITEVESLRYLSVPAVLGKAQVVAVVVALSAVAMHRRDFPEGRVVTVGLLDPIEIASAVSVFAFAFSTHTLVPQVLKELDEDGMAGARCIMQTVTLVGASLYGFMALFGYLHFGCTARTNLLTMPEYDGNPWIVASEVAVVISILFGFPTYVAPFRQTIEEVLWHAEGHELAEINVTTGELEPVWWGVWRSRAVGTVVLIVATSIAVLTDNLGDVISFTGAFGGQIFLFFFPCLSYCNWVHRDQKPLWRMCTWSGFFTLMAAVLVTFDTGYVVIKILAVGPQQPIC